MQFSFGRLLEEKLRKEALEVISKSFRGLLFLGAALRLHGFVSVSCSDAQVR